MSSPESPDASGPEQMITLARGDGQFARVPLTRLLTSEIVQLANENPRKGWAFAVRFARLSNSLAYTNRLLTAELEALRRGESAPTSAVDPPPDG